MAAQAGKSLLLKLKTGRSVYTTVAGLKSREIEFNLRPIDITDSGSTAQWRELLLAGGVKSLRIAGEGVFRDTITDETIRSNFFTNTISQWQIVIPSFGTISGSFAISELAYAGEFDGEVTWRMAFESSGEISFAAI